MVRRVIAKSNRTSRTTSVYATAAFVIFAVGAWAGWAVSLFVIVRRDGISNEESGRALSGDGISEPANAAAGGNEYNAATHRNSIDVWKELSSSLTQKRLRTIANQHKETYQNAYPFPHTVIDGLFPQSILDALLEEVPESLVVDGCYPKHRRCIQAKPTDRQYLKSSINKDEEMGPITREVIYYMMSGIFIDFLKELTGVRGLLADPMLEGGGIHLTSNGGKLDLHADFNAYKGPRLDRRVNVFLFLNPDWDDSYGGHLELWNKELTSCGQRIVPSLGRFVVFSTSDFSHHGHPHPLSAPPGRVRRSLALYYYTVGRPAEECLDGICPVYDAEGKGRATGHSTLWKEPVGCTDCLDPNCNALTLS